MEPEPPSDNIVLHLEFMRIMLYKQTIMTMTPSPMESGTYTVSGDFLSRMRDEAGPQDPQRVWRIEAEDDQGSVGTFYIQCE